MAIGKPVCNICILLHIYDYMITWYLKMSSPRGPYSVIQIPNLLFQEFIQGCRWLDDGRTGAFLMHL